jgi:hypothetical protein
MIRLGKELQLSVVAEGAETKDEVSVLRKLGCPYAQGYFFGRPMPEAEFVPLLDGKVLSFDQNDVVHHPSGLCASGRSQSAVVVEDDPIAIERSRAHRQPRQGAHAGLSLPDHR